MFFKTPRFAWMTACVVLGLGLGPRLFAFSNGDFESGSLSGWTVSTGPGSPSPSINVVGAGVAPYTNSNLSRVGQGNYSCELYSGYGGSGTTYAQISQSDIIQAGNTVLQFNYAAVLDGAHASTPASDASVLVMISTTSTVIYQVTYQYASSPAPLVFDGVTSKKHLPWTTINIDLSAYVGLTVTVSFRATDCLLGGHDCYAYVDGFNFVPPTPTFTITPTHTISPTFSITPTVTPTPTITPTFSHSPTITATYTISQTYTITPTFSSTPTLTATVTLTPTPPPLMLKLFSPNPDPALTEMWIPYGLTVDADVTIEVWTVSGEKVRSLHPGWRRAGLGAEGIHEDVWDLKNEAGNKVSNGVFIYRVRAISAANEIKEDFKKCAVSR